MLRIDVTKALGATIVEAAFASEGGVTALFGPSGAGKTSLINMIAGLLRPDRGRIELDGHREALCLSQPIAAVLDRRQGAGLRLLAGTNPGAAKGIS